MSEPVTAEEMQDVVDGLKDAKRDAQCLLTDETFDELIHFCRAGVAAIRDRDAGWSAAEKLAGRVKRLDEKLWAWSTVQIHAELGAILAAFAAARAKRNPNPEGRT